MSIEPVDSTATLRLLDAASDHDEAAIAELFDQHLPAIKHSVRRRLRPLVQARFDASDVVQETHQHARRRLDDYLRRRPMAFRLWLLRTAHERLLELERFHRQAAKRSVDCELALPDASSVRLADFILQNRVGPVSEAIAREQAVVVRKCLSQLDVKDRDVLLLRVFDDLSNAEVAQVLELKPDTAKKRFLRALVKLKELLREVGLGESVS